MSDRTQTLSVEPVVREAMVLGFVMGALVKPPDPYPLDSEIVSRVLQAAELHGDLYPNLVRLSQPEHQGDDETVEKLALRMYGVDAGRRPWLSLPEGTRESWRREARRTLAAIGFQPPAPALSDEERERLERIAARVESVFDFETPQGKQANADAAFVRNLASREHRGEEREPLLNERPFDPGDGDGRASNA